MKRVILDRKTIFACCFLGCLFPSSAFAYLLIDHLAVPGTYEGDHGETGGIYDNLGANCTPEGATCNFGQIFTAPQNALVSGFQVYIGDPYRPLVAYINELTGPAHLRLYDASDSPHASLIGEKNYVVPSGSVAKGLSTFSFDDPVQIYNGKKYFFILYAPSDAYGIGLRSIWVSTYDGGSEAEINFSSPN